MVLVRAEIKVIAVRHRSHGAVQVDIWLQLGEQALQTTASLLERLNVALGRSTALGGLVVRAL